MPKVLFLVMSGDEKAQLAIRMAYNSLKNKRFEDLKVLFFGPSQMYITKLEGEPRQMLMELIQNHAVDSACVGVATNMGIKEKLESMGVRLEPAGERVSHYVNQGYEVITF
ncbi:hypothetical protein HS1genome_2355 [Sulfodiicoccus acidiphilus]|uniref:Uncharacterized protein n=1 Tax=Sulfodiicoccus acidiphilus TaxID=1670455 RepID=A0A348B714_9CREN|nr:DsrE family protein [Sulfodiicoccus acidiphilus]BBD73966.1 hypothetical protein HS1genome_2355 [Sulfodiicoccus acidiphilus]GGU02739.1 hypothetical protein GCM10007116_19780 [Sulfodiicoccus acidiphilus]